MTETIMDEIDIAAILQSAVISLTIKVIKGTIVGIVQQTLISWFAFILAISFTASKTLPVDIVCMSDILECKTLSRSLQYSRFIMLFLNVPCTNLSNIVHRMFIE